MLELIHKLIKTCKLATKWLKPITKDPNELIGLNEYDYYSKVLKTIIIRSKKIALFGSNHTLNQGAPVGHESAETPIRHESSGS